MSNTRRPSKIFSQAAKRQKASRLFDQAKKQMEQALSLMQDVNDECGHDANTETTVAVQRFKAAIAQAGKEFTERMQDIQRRYGK